MRAQPNPPGYLNKKACASRIGISSRTFDRRRQLEPLLQEVICVGKQVFFKETAIEEYIRLVQKRGFL